MLAGVAVPCYSALILQEGNMRRPLFVTVVLLISLPSAYAGNVSTGRSPSEIGVLKCDASGSGSLILSSPRKLRCVFRPGGRAPGKAYFGELSSVGIGLGFRAPETFSWRVFAPEERLNAGLAGAYGGRHTDLIPGLSTGLRLAQTNGYVVLEPVRSLRPVGMGFSMGVASLELSPLH
jgi:hypothetical protein